jgi:hypothetical protein
MICQDQQRTSRGHRSLSNPVRVVTGPFQIEIQDTDTQAWRMYASFRFRGQAEACLDALRQRAIEARIFSTDLSQCPV